MFSLAFLLLVVLVCQSCLRLQSQVAAFCMFLRIPGPTELKTDFFLIIFFFFNLEVESKWISKANFLFVLKMFHIRVVTYSFLHPVLCGI